MTSDRKAAIAAYKERKTIAGIFVIRCNASRTMGRPGAQPRKDPEPDLVLASPWQPPLPQPAGGVDCAWAGESAFWECERLEEEETPYIRDALLKERVLHWRAKLGAEAI